MVGPLRADAPDHPVTFSADSGTDAAWCVTCGKRLVWIGEWQHPAPYADLLKELLRLHGVAQLAFVKGHDAGTRPDVCHTCRVLKGEAR